MMLRSTVRKAWISLLYFFLLFYLQRFLAEDSKVVRATRPSQLFSYDQLINTVESFSENSKLIFLRIKGSEAMTVYLLSD